MSANIWSTAQAEHGQRDVQASAQKLLPNGTVFLDKARHRVVGNLAHVILRQHLAVHRCGVIVGKRVRSIPASKLRGVFRGCSGV